MPVFDDSATPDTSALGALRDLAMDLSIRWDADNDAIWRAIDEELWTLTGNPCLVLHAASRQRLEATLATAPFRRRLEALDAERRARSAAPTWFGETLHGGPLRHIAYFCMEYMLSETLPIYSGGLGNVAGDQLRAADDLGVPVTAVGLLWQHGYFRQEINAAGEQQALYPVNDTHHMPVRPLYRADGSLVRLRIVLPGITLWIRAWEARIGRNRLLLLDTNDPANPPQIRLITSELYGGGSEMRLRQEIVLGIGGWRLLREIGIEPDVLHLNEGHAAFAVLERARHYMHAHAVPFEVAMAVTRAGNVFTTHTPVEAGFDRFPPELAAKYLRRYAEQELHLPMQALLALGRRHADDPDEPLNMAFLATRCSGGVNAVSALHGETSRRIFTELFPRWPEREVPIGHVTNGIHVPTWIAREARPLWEKAAGAGAWSGDSSAGHDDLAAVDDAALWALRQATRRCLVEFTREHVARSIAIRGASVEQMEIARSLFDPAALTLGFARRFATYKRPNLLLADPDRLLRILNDPQRPVQLLIAGKAHPADTKGQAMVREWAEFSRLPEARGRIAFLADYDMRVARHLVQGVDVWVNTPRRPWEASGTSGMKVLANGGLNLSQLDGWWAEAHTPELGWGIGDGEEHDARWDRADAMQLYDLLENEVVPEFYERDDDGLPRAWLARIRASMAQLTARFSADRTVREYVERYYLPAARQYRERAGADILELTERLRRREALAAHWHDVRILDWRAETVDGRHRFAVSVHTGAVDPALLRIELYADAVGDAPAEAVPLARQTGQREGRHLRFVGEVPARRPAAHYTARVIGALPGQQVPLEVPQIAWAS
ncbi:alpha-glucan family phosphorylase [Coralloluteibacterium thermophilus]|uniref:Alpha-glucan family phosphorylase n=1 Tax=Coralloluteibacterium thermophilum TaxID=2707049 RepID=A0ABV9NLF6_9GAMM